LFETNLFVLDILLIKTLLNTLEHIENDNEWMNNKYATAVMAEHQNNYTMTSYDCDRTLFSQHDNNCLQHHVYQQERQTFIPIHNEVPTSSIGYIDNRIISNVSALFRFGSC
jgi:hypothetical protein